METIGTRKLAVSTCTSRSFRFLILDVLLIKKGKEEKEVN